MNDSGSVTLEEKARMQAQGADAVAFGRGLPARDEASSLSDAAPSASETSPIRDEAFRRRTPEKLSHVDLNVIDVRNARLLEEADRTVRRRDVNSLVERVARRVVGQRDQIRQVVEYVCLWLDRHDRVRAGVDGCALPRMGSLMLLGPTASGKTYLLRCVCEEVGLPLTVVNSSTLTGPGWRGVSIDTELAAVAREQQRRRGALRVMLFDEFDKTKLEEFEREPSFNAQPGMLKVLDGGLYRSRLEDGDREEFVLDTNDVLFMFAGAFTGIGKKHVAPRLRREAYSLEGAKADDEDKARLAYCDDEAELARHVQPSDLTEWGIMSELVGRIGTMVTLPALSEAELSHIVNDSPFSLQERFGSLLPEGVGLSIGKEAASSVSRRALAGGLGARALESELVGHVAHAAEECRRNLQVREVCLNVDAGDELQVSYRLADAPRVEENPCAPDLIPVVFERIRKLGDARPLVERALLEAGARIVASEPATAPETARRRERAALFTSFCLSLLIDFFPESDHTMESLVQLADMESFDPGHALSHRSRLSCLMVQVTEGYRHGRKEGAGESGKDAFVREPTLFRRRDGRRPADCGGFGPQEDFTVRLYETYCELPLDERMECVKACWNRVTYLTDHPSVCHRILQDLLDEWSTRGL